MTTNEKIQYYRKKLGLSQEELGQQLLVSRQTVSLWENGQTAPTIDNLIRLKEIFGVSVDELLGCENETEEETEKPTESYSISYTKEELKKIDSFILKRSFKKPLVSLAIFAALLVAYIIMDMPDILIGLFGGFLVIWAILVFKSIRSHKKEWKNANDRVSESCYEYNIFDDYFTVDIIRNNETIRTEKIKFSDIKKAFDFEEEKYIILNINNQLYILRKTDLANNSAFYKALYNSKKAVSTRAPKKITVAANTFFVLSLIIIFVSTMLNGWDTEMKLKAWMFLLPMPIPIISTVFGFILKKYGCKYKKNIVAGVLALIMLFLFNSFYGWLSDDSYDSVEYLTDVLGINMPEDEISRNTISYNYENQPTDTGFIFRHTKVNFEEFSSDYFENNMKYDTRWLTSVPESLKETLAPIEYDEGHKYADRIMIYNEFNGEFNAPLTPNGFHNFIAVFYFTGENKAEIFEYEYDLSPQQTE